MIEILEDNILWGPVIRFCRWFNRLDGMIKFIVFLVITQLFIHGFILIMEA